MSGTDATIHTIPLPPAMVDWAASIGFHGLRVSYSPIAIAIELGLGPTLDGVRGPMSLLISAVREAAIYADTPWPLVVLVDVGALPPDQQPARRAELRELANDPTWHKGDCCLYVTPVEPRDLPPGWVPWQGPRSSADLRQLLLDKDVTGVDAVHPERLDLLKLRPYLDNDALPASLRARLLELMDGDVVKRRGVDDAEKGLTELLGSWATAVESRRAP